MSVLARHLAAATALAGALALSACGFTPLYATPGVTPGLTTIKVVVPHGRTAFLLGEALEDELGTDKAAAPAYRLNVTVYERIFPRGLNLNGVAERYEMHVRIDYKLTAVGAPDKVLTEGLDPVEITYCRDRPALCRHRRPAGRSTAGGRHRRPAHPGRPGRVFRQPPEALRPSRRDPQPPARCGAVPERAHQGRPRGADLRP